MNFEGLTIGAILMLGVGMISACSGQSDMHFPISGQYSMLQTSVASQGCTNDVDSDGSCHSSDQVAIASYEACDGEDCSPQASLESYAVSSTRYCNRGNHETEGALATTQQPIYLACY